MKTLKDRCQEEGTKNVVFLLKRVSLNVIGNSEKYEFIDDFFYNKDNDTFMSIKEMYDSRECFGDFDTPCVIKEYIAESIWLTREEAEEFAKEHYYNYPYGWEVYGLPADGNLVNLIKES